VTEPIVRFGAGTLDELGDLTRELGLSRPVLVTTHRGATLARRTPALAVYDGVRRHAPRQTVDEAIALARMHRADSLVALGGGSAIDTTKAVSALEELPFVAVPTTYSGAEWTSYFGMRDEATGRKEGGTGSRLAGVVYDPELTLTLPRDESGGSALNALAHAAEAFYAKGRRRTAAGHGASGASAIGEALPLVLADGSDLEARTRLLEGAWAAGRALGEGGLALGHALAQALGGRFGLPHGALNAVVLPSALRFNEAVVPRAIARLGQALAADDAIARVEELAELAGFTRLRDLGVPSDELDEVGALAAVRPAARANPRPVTATQAAKLLRGVW
jgi:maleylacetate reductase